MKVMRDADSEVQMPDDLKDGKDRMVFGNIEAIYDFHNDTFCKALERCIDMPAELGPLFKKYERKLRMYVVYCKNKPVSEYIVSEYLETYFEDLRISLGHKLQICDLLIKPVQRIMKYQLLLKDILKHTERAGLTGELENLRAAVEVMTIVPQAANNMMDVGRLQGFNGSITAQGQLLLNGPLICSDIPGSSNPCIGKNKELHVFLFEQSIIFSEAVGKKTQFTSPRYVYKAHFQVNKMSLSPPTVNSECFTLKSTDPHKPTQGFVCQAPSQEMYEKWITTLEDIFQTQKDFLKAIQSPIAYQNKLTKDPVDMSSLWCPNSPSRRSAPVSTSTPASPISTKAPHRNTVPIHKANTIGIPPDPDGGNATESKHGKKFIFGFRNTLRSKSKTETISDGSKDNDKNDMQRSWCENGQTTLENNTSPIGNHPRIIVEYPNESLKYDLTQGDLTRRNSDEFWITENTFSNSPRKPWSFRFRKNSRKSIDESAYVENMNTEYPEFIEKIKDVTVIVGSRVILKCKATPCLKNTSTTWKKIHPDSWIIRNSGRTLVSQSEEGEGLLIINNAKLTDSGVYACTISNENAYIECTATLTVLNSDVHIPELKAQVISCSSVLVEWENTNHKQFLVEYCKVGSGEWISPNNNLSLSSPSYVIEHLVPSDTYSFRLVTLPSRQVGLPSAAITLPVADNLRWQQEQFKRRYIELDEIDRGRCAIVRKAQDRGTGQEVALKQVFRRKQSHQVTQAEYTLLVGLQHTNIIHAMALFDNAPVPGIDTIVLELVHGPLLFSYIVQSDAYTEGDICSYVKQLVIALAWLHNKDIAHLDIKPENIMVDLSHGHPTLKLVDFGDCVNTAKNVILPPTCLEFASPELVLGQQVGKHTDLWAVGVLIYVMLSGVSPFLDDSVEETTANILKCDFCFPDDYFSSISEKGKALIKLLLNLVPKQRINMDECLQNQWFENINDSTVICSSRLRAFLQRRHRTAPSPSNLPINNINI